MYFILFESDRFSDDGRLHKAININSKMYIIEEMVIFPDGQPVQHIELDSDKVECTHFCLCLLF